VVDSHVGLRGHRVQNQERAEARRRDILLAGARVFARDGFTAATLDDVARELGVTKGVIYYYFRSKEEIYTAIQEIVVVDSTNRLQAIIAQGDPPVATLTAAVRDLAAHVCDDLDRFIILQSADSGISVEGRARVRALRRNYQRIMRGIVEAGVRDGVFVNRDPVVMTFTVIAACLGIANWYRPAGRLPLHAVQEQVVAQVLAGVLRPGVTD
jgi:TetR/AcrR family transcriptional regulator, cholesterol catabolism regulator